MEEEASVSDYIFSYLRQRGIEKVFYLPGGGAMHLNDALARSNVSTAMCLNEQSVAIAAEYHGRVSKQPFGVAVVTNGPGATNTLTAVAGAYIESVPLLIISGQVKLSDYNSSKKLRQTGVQEVATLEMVKGITKYATIIKRPQDIHLELEKCWEQLTSGRMGPVWIEVPLDVQAAKVRRGSVPLSSFGVCKDFGIDIRRDVVRINDLLRPLAGKFVRPLMLVGQGVRHANAVEDVMGYASRYNIPVVTTFPAKDFIEFTNKLFVGHPGNVALRGGNLAVQNCDLLISIGSSLNNIVTAYNPKLFAKNAQKIIFDIDTEELRKHEIPNSIKIKAGVKDAIIGLEESQIVSIQIDQSWLEYLKHLKSKYSYPHDIAFADMFKAKDGGRLSIYQVVDKLSYLLCEYKLIITGSSGLCIEAFYMLFRNQEGQRIIIDSGLGSMGYGLPALIGACNAAPTEKVILYEGDGSLQMNIQELATIAGNNYNCLIIVISNNGYASIKNSQKGYFDGRLLGCDAESGLHLPKLRGLVEAYEIQYYGVWAIEDLTKAVDMSRKVSGPVVIEVFTDGEVTLQPRVKSIKLEDGKMVSLPIEDMMPLLDLGELKAAMKYADKIEEESYRIRQ